MHDRVSIDFALLMYMHPVLEVNDWIFSKHLPILWDTNGCAIMGDFNITLDSLEKMVKLTFQGFI